jgi:hypothetical protein
MQRYTRLYDTIQEYTTLYDTVQHYTTLYKTIQQYIRLYDTVYTTLCNTTTLQHYNTTQRYTSLYDTMQDYTALYFIHYRRLLYKTKQDYTTLHKTIRHYKTLYVLSMFSFVVGLIVIYPVPVMAESTERELYGHLRAITDCQKSEFLLYLIQAASL